MNIKTLVLAAAMAAFAGTAIAATAPAAPAARTVTVVDGHKTTCKIVHGKKKCHKSPFKAKKVK